MRWITIFGALIIGSQFLAVSSLAQTTEIINKRVCIDVRPDTPAPKSKCADVTSTEEAACPTGPCWSYETDGCQYLNQPKKSSQRVKKNDGEVATKIDVTATHPFGKVPEEDEDKRIVCHEEKDCRCVYRSFQHYECEASDVRKRVLVVWKITERPCELDILVP